MSEIVRDYAARLAARIAHWIRNPFLIGEGAKRRPVRPGGHPRPGPPPRRPRLADRRPASRREGAGGGRRPARSVGAARRPGPARRHPLRRPAARRPQSRRACWSRLLFGWSQDELFAGVVPARRRALAPHSWREVAIRGEDRPFRNHALRPPVAARHGRLRHPPRLPRDDLERRLKRSPQAAGKARKRGARPDRGTALRGARVRIRLGSLAAALPRLVRPRRGRDRPRPLRPPRRGPGDDRPRLERPAISDSYPRRRLRRPGPEGGRLPGQLRSTSPSRRPRHPHLPAPPGRARRTARRPARRPGPVASARSIGDSSTSPSPGPRRRLYIGGALGPADRRGPPPRAGGPRSTPRSPASAPTGTTIPIGDGPAASATRRSSPRPRRARPPRIRLCPTGSAGPAPVEARPPRPLAPSALGEDDVADPPPSPSLRAAAQRGRLLHQLFERLPDVPAGRARRARRPLASRARPESTTTAQRRELIEAVERVIGDPAHAELFGPGALAEAPIAAVVGEGIVVSGIGRPAAGRPGPDPRRRLQDRPPGAGLARRDTGPPPPADGRLCRGPEEWSFPAAAIEAKLLYTAAPILFALPPALLDRHKPALEPGAAAS